ncbi:MAG: efflux RND transporter periplasmic adaptor subunit [Candidatus Eremiobacteraeota bacterium]|nr:efflux RND transporter periplasmic adaptor subunit [Candidatus Eremiobacteraeota bacterium]
MKPILLLILLSVTLAGCGQGGGGKGGRQGPPPVPITLLTLEKGELAERVSLLGESRSQADAAIKTQTEGVVSQLLVDVGDEIVAGQDVAYLDGLEQRLALAEADARLAEARSRLSELQNGTRSQVLQQRRAETRASHALQREAETDLKAVRDLAPQLIKQVEGDFQAARAAEKNAQDEYKRTQELVKQGALSARELVRVESAWEQAKGELLRAERALAVQKVSNERDEAGAVAALERARAESAKSEAVLDESLEGPRDEVVAAQAEIVAALEAARERAALEYQRASVKAPSSGTVRQRMAAVGERLDIGDTLFQVAGEDVALYFDAPESVHGKVETGQTVLLESEGSTEPIPAKVVAVARAVDPNSRRQSFRVEAPEGALLPGEAVRGTLLIPLKGDYLTVHRDALVDKGDRWVVYTVDGENKAVEQKVDYLLGVDETVAISSPKLKAGESVVGRGAPGLYPGATVMLPQASPTPGSTP